MNSPILSRRSLNQGIDLSAHNDRARRLYVFSSIRLTAQHFLWKEHLGWNLHPDVLSNLPQSRPLSVADVACGNGIWISQESRSPAYPAGTKFHGFDVSDAQVPSTVGLPENVTFSILNASHSSNIPSEFHEAFDIVHVRLIIGAVPEPTPISFLHSFLTLLRHGGFLQWDEVNTYNCQPFPALPEPCIWNGWVPRTTNRYRPDIDRPMTWFEILPALFEAEEMTHIRHINGGPTKPHMRRYWTDNEFGVFTEIATSHKADQDVLEELAKGEKERKQDLFMEIRITIGQKALK